MAKIIVKYRQIIRDSIPKNPDSLESAGHFAIGSEYIAVTYDTDECYVPSDFVQLTEAELVTRVEGLSITDSVLVALTTAQKTIIANDWLTQHGFTPP